MLTIDERNGKLKRKSLLKSESDRKIGDRIKKEKKVIKESK